MPTNSEKAPGYVHAAGQGLRSAHFLLKGTKSPYRKKIERLQERVQALYDEMTKETHVEHSGP